VVPIVVLDRGGARLQLPEHEPVYVGPIEGLTRVLDALREDHPVDDSWILMPSADVEYNEMVRAIDAAAAARFTEVSVAGGSA